MAVAVQLKTRCDLAHAQAAADVRPRPILQSRDPSPSHSQEQDGGVSSLELPRVLHVPFQQEYVLASSLLSPTSKSMLFQPASERVAVSLQTNVVNPAAPAVSFNPDINLGWVAEGCTGVRQHAYRPDAIYTPLFCLKEIRRPLLRRDESGLGRGG